MIDSFQGEYRFLSNFFEGPEPVLWNGHLCPTAEHAYQSSKVNSLSMQATLATTGTPGAAKRAGRNAELRHDWDEIRLHIMRGILAVKFQPDSTLAVQLLATGEQMLVEGNYWNDRFWGVCKGQGRNWLGHLLMARRAELRGIADLEATGHIPAQVGERHQTKGDVCLGCSDADNGRWTPINQCATAMALAQGDRFGVW